MEIIVGITCTSVRRKKEHWKEQLKEINQLKIKKAAVFPTTLVKKERQEFYAHLDNSCLKEIPLVHLRGDFGQEELIYFRRRFKTNWFNCHESDLDLIYQRFSSFRKNILLEMDYNNKIENRLSPLRIGGFCIDLSHLKAAQDNNKLEYNYVLNHLDNVKFQANHLNGYSRKRKRDLHFVTNKNQFAYLTDLPKKVFGDIAALELENSICKQLEFKEYLMNTFF